MIRLQISDRPSARRALVAARLVLLVALLLPARSALAEWLFDVDLGIPKLKSGDLRLSGDLALGWGLEHMGLSVGGGAGWYDFESASLLENNLEARAQLEGFYLLGAPTAPLRGEFRLTAGYVYTDVEYLARGATALLFNDHTSNFVRTTLFGGGRLRLGPVYARLLVGAGLQWESFNDLRVDQGINVSDTESWTFRFALRALVRWTVWSGWLSLRLDSEVERFFITRDKSSITLEPSGKTLTDAITLESVQWSARNHLALEVDKLQVFDLVPALFFGLEVYAISGENARATTIVPVFGVALSKHD